MRVRPLAWIGSVLPLLLAVPALATDAAGPVIWFRASDGCPTGPEFLGKVRERAQGARLAEAGDHFDFIVTLVSEQSQTVGRLERQTQTGTVAIRELRDANCGRVAEALALNLELAILPTDSPPEPASTAKQDGEAAAAPAPPGFELTAPPPPIADQPAERSRKSKSKTRDSPPPWAAAFEGGAMLGVMPEPMAHAGAFVERARAVPSIAQDLAIRFGVVGAVGDATTQVGPVRHWVLAGHAEVCPWRVGAGRWHLSPCAALEVGVTGATDDRPSALHATSPWLAPGLPLRGALRLVGELALEMQTEALLPLRRNTIYAGNTALYEGDVVVLVATLGLSLRAW